MWNVLWTTLLVSLVLAVVLGNGLVVVAILYSKHLRRQRHLDQLRRLVLSLAVADLLVGLCVLPFSLGVHLHRGKWPFGEGLCQLWLAADVWLCTASIYNLLAIALDRFLAVTRPLRYTSLVTPRTGKLLIAGAWLTSLALSAPPVIYAWPEATNLSSSALTTFHQSIDTFNYSNIYETNSTSISALKRCSPLNNDSGYIIVSALASFFGPMIVLVYFYSKIYLEARGAARFDGAPETQNNSKLNCAVKTSNFRAARTSAVVTGLFLASWLGFALVYLLRAFSFCQPYCVPHVVTRLFIWLGYANSAVNPLVYAATHSQFRRAFLDVMCFWRQRRSTSTDSAGNVLSVIK